MASPAAHLDNTGRRGWGPALCPGLVGNVEQFRARTPGQFCTVTEERGTLASHFGLLCLRFLPEGPELVRVKPVEESDVRAGACVSPRECCGLKQHRHSGNPTVPRHQQGSRLHAVPKLLPPARILPLSVH